MTIQHTESVIIKELSAKGGIANLFEMECLDSKAMASLEVKELVAKYGEKVILTDVGMEVAEYLKRQ